MNRVSRIALALAGLALAFAGQPAWAEICVASDTGTSNTACGTGAGNNDAGTVNSAFGDRALSSNTTGRENTATGTGALLYNGAGNNNSAFGATALFNNTAGSDNTASGVAALSANTTGNSNTANGSAALEHNTASNNTANGYGALFSNTTGSYNTASGAEALYGNTKGFQNTASGGYALSNNTTGNYNTANGDDALLFNTKGNDNTAAGAEALYNNATGDQNTAVGFGAGATNAAGNDNTFIGYNANTNAANYSNGTALGYDAVLTGSNTIVLGNNKITAIRAEVPHISGLSDRRLKKDIADLGSDLGLAFIEKLKPVSYRFKNGDETQRYGFIAQDLEQALPATLHDTVENSQPEHGLALIDRDNDPDRTYHVAYGELTAPMVKAIQEQQQEIAALKSENAELRQSIAAIHKQVDSMTAARTSRRTAKVAATRAAPMLR